MNRTWLYISLSLVAILLATHLYALHTFLYWHYHWFDIPMHVFGGAALGAFLLAFGKTRRTWTYLLCMLAIVVGWEVFEYFGKISTGQPDYWIDTIDDIINGLFGSLLTLIVARKTTWR